METVSPPPAPQNAEELGNMLRCWQPNAAAIVEATATRVSLRRASKRASPQPPPPPPQPPRSTPPPPPPQTPPPLRKAAHGIRCASGAPDCAADAQPGEAPFVTMTPLLTLLEACENGQHPVVVGFFPQNTRASTQLRAFDQAARQHRRSAVFRKCCPVESPDIAQVCGVDSGKPRIVVFRPEAETLSLGGDDLLRPAGKLGRMLGVADVTAADKPTPDSSRKLLEALPEVVRQHPAFKHSTTLQELEEASAPKDGESAPVVVLNFIAQSRVRTKRMLNLCAHYGERAVFLWAIADDTNNELNVAFKVFEPAMLVLRGGKEEERLPLPRTSSANHILEAYLGDNSPNSKVRALSRRWTKAYSTFPSMAAAQVERTLCGEINPELKLVLGPSGVRVEGGTLLEAFKLVRLAEASLAVINGCNTSMRVALSTVARKKGYLFAQWIEDRLISDPVAVAQRPQDRPHTCALLRTGSENPYKMARTVTLAPFSRKSNIRDMILRKHFWALGHPLLLPTVTNESGDHLLCANAPLPVGNEKLYADFPNSTGFNGVCTESLSLSDFVQRAETCLGTTRPLRSSQPVVLYATRTQQGGVVAVVNNLRGWVFAHVKASILQDAGERLVTQYKEVTYLAFRQDSGQGNTISRKLLRDCSIMQRAELVVTEGPSVPACLARVRAAKKQDVLVLFSGKRAALLGSVISCDAVLAKWKEDGVSMLALDEKSWGQADSTPACPQLKALPQFVRFHAAFQTITTLQELEEVSAPTDGVPAGSAPVSVLTLFDSRLHGNGKVWDYIRHCLELCRRYAGRAVFRWVDVSGPGQVIATALKVEPVPVMLVLRGGDELDRLVGADFPDVVAMLETHLGDDSPNSAGRLLPPSWCHGFAALAPDARAEIARRVCSEAAGLRLDVADQSAVRVLGGTLSDARSAVARARDSVAVVNGCSKSVCQALRRAAAQEGYAFATLEQKEEEVEGAAPPSLSSCVLARLEGGKNRFLTATACTIEAKGAGAACRLILVAHFSACACPLVINPLTDEADQVGLVFATKKRTLESVRVAFLDGSTDDFDGLCPELVSLSDFVPRAESAVRAQRLRAPERHSSLPQAALVYAARVKHGGVVAVESNLRGWVLAQYSRRLQECHATCEAEEDILYLSYLANKATTMDGRIQDVPLREARRLQRAELVLADDAPARAFTDRVKLAKQHHNVVVLCTGRRAALLGSTADCKKVVAEWRQEGLDMCEVAEHEWGAVPAPEAEQTRAADAGKGECAVDSADDAADTAAGDKTRNEGSDAEAFAELIGHIEDSSTEVARLQEAEREADVAAETDKAHRERLDLAQSLRALVAHTAAVRDAALAYWPLDDDEALKKATTSVSLDLEALSLSLAKEMSQFYEVPSAAVPEEEPLPFQERSFWDNMLERGYKEGAESMVWTHGSWDDAMCVKDLFGLDNVTGEVGTVLDWRLLTSSTRHGSRRTRVMVLDTSSLLAQKLPTQRDTKIVIPFTTLRELKQLRKRDEIGERAQKRFEEVLARLREPSALCNVALLGPKEEVALYRESERAAYSLARTPSIRVPDDRILLAAYAVRREMKDVARSCHGDARRQNLADAVLMLSEDQELNSRASEMRLGTTVPPLLCSSD